MPTFGTLKLKPEHEAESQARLTRIREQWINDVTALVQQVTDWAHAASEMRGWVLDTETKERFEEVVGGKYTVPMLIIRAGENDLHVEPIARGVLRANGRVDLYAYPSLFRVMLLRNKTSGEWFVRTDSGLDWPQPWGQETFLALADGLLKAE